MVRDKSWKRIINNNNRRGNSRDRKNFQKDSVNGMDKESNRRKKEKKRKMKGGDWRKGARGSRGGYPTHCPNWPKGLPDIHRRLSNFQRIEISRRFLLPVERTGRGGTLWFKVSRSGRHARSAQVLQRLRFLYYYLPFTFFTLCFLFLFLTKPRIGIYIIKITWWLSLKISTWL